MNFKEEFSQELAEKFLNEAIIFLKNKNLISDDQQISIGLVNVSKRKIKNLNHNYRKKNQATDILSFGYNYDKKKIEGDLILCWNIIQENVEGDDNTLNRELKKNLIHGCLHLIGWEHSEKMFKLQDEFLNL